MINLPLLESMRETKQPALWCQHHQMVIKAQQSNLRRSKHLPNQGWLWYLLPPPLISIFQLVPSNSPTLINMYVLSFLWVVDLTWFYLSQRFPGLPFRTSQTSTIGRVLTSQFSRNSQNFVVSWTAELIRTLVDDPRLLASEPFFRYTSISIYQKIDLRVSFR